MVHGESLLCTRSPQVHPGNSKGNDFMKAADIKEREKLAREIVNRFLGESAPEQVNVDAGSVRSTREKVEAGYFEEDLFSAAHKVALGNMEWDSARYYVTSTFYKGITYRISH